MPWRIAITAWSSAERFLHSRNRPTPTTGLKELASHFGYSESYMYRLFFKETGYAPMNYFLHMKIDRACQLLLHTNMKINQVALKLGFDDPYYFSRIFKKIVGTSPKDYRHSLPK